MKKQCILIVTIALICCCCCMAHSSESDSSDLTCRSLMNFKNVTLTAYYPSDDEMNDSMEYLDMRGNALATLQDYLDDNAHYVTVSMDGDLRIPYGTQICIPELNAHYRRRINFQIRDTASNVKAQGYRRVDICVRSEADSYDHAVNLKQATIYF